MFKFAVSTIIVSLAYASDAIVEQGAVSRHNAAMAAFMENMADVAPWMPADPIERKESDVAHADQQGPNAAQNGDENEPVNV